MGLDGFVAFNLESLQKTDSISGSTVRLAQSIGLHEEAIAAESKTSCSPDRPLRCRLWCVIH